MQDRSITPLELQRRYDAIKALGYRIDVRDMVSVVLKKGAYAQSFNAFIDAIEHAERREGSS